MFHFLVLYFLFIGKRLDAPLKLHLKVCHQWDGKPSTLLANSFSYSFAISSRLENFSIILHFSHLFYCRN